MPLRKGNRYLTFLIVASLVVCLLALRASANKEGMGAILAILGLLVRQEYAERKARQSRSTIISTLRRQEEKQDVAVTAVEEVKQAAAVLVHQTNGELDARIVRAVCTAIDEKLPVAVAAAIKPVAERLANLDTYVHKWKHDSVQREQADILEKEIAKRERKQEKP